VRWLIALVALAVVTLGVPTTSHAATYTVAQCDRASAALNPAAADAVADEPWPSYQATNRCGSGDDALKVKNLAFAGAGKYARWRYLAPAGTVFVAAKAQARLVRDAGHQPQLYVDSPASGPVDVIAGDTVDTKWHVREWQAPGGGSETEFGVRLRCAPASGDSCDRSPDAEAWMRDIELTLNDTAAPSVLVDGSLLSGGWQSGRRSLAVSAGDVGAGVRRIQLEANGASAAARTFDCETIPGRSLAARLQPCAPAQVASFDLDTTRAPFREGSNQLRICVEDYGSGSVNRTCTTRTVKVDNVGPGAPQNLTVAGGSDWRYINDFDISWDNPEQPPGSSEIDEAYLQIERPDGTIVNGPMAIAGPNPSAATNQRVPQPGVYVARVWLRDQAGNVSSGSTALLRFDDAVSSRVLAQWPPGWLSRSEADAPYTQVWAAPAELPVSGIRGYSVAVDRFPGTNPCETPTDPDPAVCSPGEITNPDVQSSVQDLVDLAEGVNYVHIVAVSGAGLRSSEVSHTEIKVDRTDPVARLLDLPSGWCRDPVTLVVQATDQLSGMQPVPDDDGRPYTAMQIDDGPVLSDPDNEVTRVVADEGDQVIRYWARDLAGNDTAASPGVARLRIDRTAPTVAFANAQDPSDPEMVRASVSDSLSGLASGVISYRREGGETWQPLVTTTSDARLEARLPSESLVDGRYELRAEARDQAGNVATSNLREDGSPMVLDLPLKVSTNLRASIGSSGHEKTVGYGHPSHVRGRLFDAAGAPVADAALDVSERFDDGSLAADQTRTVVTDGRGRFSVGLAPGTSRTIELDYAGSRRYRSTGEQHLRLDVRGSAQLSVSKRRPRVGRRFRFGGRVRHFAARMPGRGKLVELQVKRPGGWDTVKQAFRTRPDGRWRFPFRFGNYYFEPTRFRFRLKVAQEGDWPYRPMTTASRIVTVVPR
jgi:hypothetical protein